MDHQNEVREGMARAVVLMRELDKSEEGVVPSIVLPLEKGNNPQFVGGVVRYNAETPKAPQCGAYTSGESGTPCGPDTYVADAAHDDTLVRGGIESRAECFAEQFAVVVPRLGERMTATPKGAFKMALGGWKPLQTRFSK